AASTCDPLMKEAGGVQRIRYSAMLVVRGPKTNLAPLTGIFPDIGGGNPKDGLFLVAREDGADCIWLVSDGRSKVLGDNTSLPLPDENERSEDWARRWVPQTIRSLEKLSPCFRPSLRPTYHWGVYPAHKAEHVAGDGPKSVPCEVTAKPFGA